MDRSAASAFLRWWWPTKQLSVEYGVWGLSQKRSLIGAPQLMLRCPNYRVARCIRRFFCHIWLTLLSNPPSFLIFSFNSCHCSYLTLTFSLPHLIFLWTLYWTMFIAAKVKSEAKTDYTAAHIRLRSKQPTDWRKRQAVRKALEMTVKESRQRRPTMRERQEDFIAMSQPEANAEEEEEKLYQEYSVFAGLDLRQGLPSLNSSS